MNRGRAGRGTPGLGLAAEERLGVLLAVRRQAGVRRDALPRRRRRLLDREVGVLTQDRLLQGDQVGSGVESQLLLKHDPDPAEGPQRLHLPPRLVLRLREQRPPPFAQGRGLDHRGRLGQHLGVMARGQRGLDRDLLQLQPHLLQTMRLRHTRLPRLELAQRSTTPQLQGLTRDVPCVLALPERQQLASPARRMGELDRVDRVGGHAEPVALGRRLDRAGAQEPAQPADAALQVLRPGGRRFVPPHGVRELFRRAQLPGADGQRCKDDPVTHPERRTAFIELQRTQESDPHHSTVNPAPTPVKSRDTREIPVEWAGDTGRVHNGLHAEATASQSQGEPP